MKLTVPNTNGTDNDAGQFSHWDSGYKVTVLAKPGRCLDLPGEKTHISRNQVLENEDTLVCGEAGGGHSRFLRWWRSALTSSARDWIHVDSSAWDGSFFRRRSGDDRSGESGAQDQAVEAIEKLGLEQGVVNRTQALRRWSEKLERPFTLIICNLMALGSGPALEVATTLRRLREPRPLCPNLRVVVSSPSESIFADQIDRSGYRALCEEYRLPSLDADDVARLAGTQSSDPDRSPLSFEEKALERFLTHTGGQPLLVWHLLARLGGLVKKSAPATTAQVDEAARQMRYSPPGRAGYWQEDLRRLLTEAPELVSAMESYVAGASLGPARFPPPAEDRALFIAGWVRLNEMGRWGITSSFHAHLARPVLQGLRTGE